MWSVVEASTAYGPWIIAGTIALLAIFFLLRGRVRIDKGWAGFNIVRFGRIERLTHWLLAVSLVVLLLTRLTAQYGPELLPPLLGKEVFEQVRSVSRPMLFWADLPFLAALVLAFLLWVPHSLPHWRDAVWLAKGGGLVVRGVHPPAHRFNAGQKLLFWIVIIGGAWLYFSPGYVAMLVLACAVIVHIYLRTVGIQGAASAMISGEVDANWARQHHSLWAEAEVNRFVESTESDAAETAGVRTP